MLTLYGIPNCNTVKKARAWLEENNVQYEFHDYKKKGIDDEIIQNWMAQEPWEKLINRAGMTYRKLSDQEKAAIIDEQSAAQLMKTSTSVIKRPIIEKNGKILTVGFNELVYADLLA